MPPGRARSRPAAALAVLAPTLLVGIPLVAVAGAWLGGPVDAWPHLSSVVLPRAALNTLFVAVGVAAIAAVLGVSLAWLTAVCDFPGRRWLTPALMLPLALPGYVLAIALTGALERGGVVGLLPPAVLPPRLAAIVVLALSLYPYVYLLARAAFASQGRHGLEVARSLGHGPWRAFLRVSLPLARPFVLAGLSLVVMETLADFGTVAVFNVDTLTLAIYKTWYGFFSVHGALQLAAFLLLVVLLLAALDWRWRAGARYAADVAARPPRLALEGPVGLLAAVWALLVFALAFALPVVQLLAWGLPRAAAEFDTAYFGYALNSLRLALIAALLTVTAGALLALGQRALPHGTLRRLSALATLGYALPGTVLAVAMFVAVGALGDWLGLGASVLGIDWSPALQASLATLLAAYVIRFLAVAHGPIASQLQRVRPSIEEAARGLGVGGPALFARVQWPIMRPGLLIAGLLVFVDVMKELPITLMTRPFGWDTLATRVFQMTTEGEWERAGLPALAIVLAGLAPVVVTLAQVDRRA